MHSALQTNFIIFPKTISGKSTTLLTAIWARPLALSLYPAPTTATSSPSSLLCLMSGSHHILLPSCKILGPSSSSRAGIPHSAHPKACPIALLRTLCGLPHLLRLNSPTWLTSPLTTLTTVADTWCSLCAGHCSVLLTPVVLPTTSGGRRCYHPHSALRKRPREVGKVTHRQWAEVGCTGTCTLHLLSGWGPARLISWHRWRAILLPYYYQSVRIAWVPSSDSGKSTPLEGWLLLLLLLPPSSFEIQQTCYLPILGRSDPFIMPHTW